MDRIKQTLNIVASQSAEDKCFSVMKFNKQDQYIGFSSGNSKVPLEGTHVPLGRGQHLVWFEGSQTNQNIRNKVAKPMHIEFVYPSLKNADEPDFAQKNWKNHSSYIQDAINLSGANWRGFNAKHIPISVYYAEIIARYIENFDMLGLKPVNIDGCESYFLRRI